MGIYVEVDPETGEYGDILTEEEYQRLVACDEILIQFDINQEEKERGEET